MELRPEAERKLCAGVARRVDQQRERFAEPLRHAEQLAAHFRAGSVVGVFTGTVEANVRPIGYVIGLLPMLAIPIVIYGMAHGVPIPLPVLAASPFAIGAWFGLSLFRYREPSRTIWFYAFGSGFMLLDGSRSDPAPVPWDQVVEVQDVWTERSLPGDQDTGRPVHTGYALRLADGRVREVSRSFENVRDPYRQVGRLLTAIMPAAVAATMPAFPTVDLVIDSYARAGRR